MCRELGLKKLKVLDSVLSVRFLRVCWNILSKVKTRLLQLIPRTSQKEKQLLGNKIYFIEIDTYFGNGFALPIHLLSYSSTTTHTITECLTHSHVILQRIASN